MAKDIVIKGANENNLKNIDVTIPRDRFVVLTGLSGSGKSSLAFDTIYAEGPEEIYGEPFLRMPASSSGRWRNRT